MLVSNRSHVTAIGWLLLVALLLGGGVAFGQSQGARVSGTVKDAEGKPVEGVTVHLEPAPGVPTAPDEETTNKKGRFSFANLFPGVYTVHVAERDWAITRVKFATRGGADLSNVSGFDLAIAPGEAPATFSAIALLRASLDIWLTPRMAPEPQDAAVLQGAEDASGKLAQLNDLFNKGDWAGLIAAAETVIAETPDLGGAYYLRGIALWQNGSKEEALGDLQKARELTPDQPGINGTIASLQLEIAGAYRDEGRVEEALPLFENAATLLETQLAETPDSVVYLTNHVVALEGAGRVEESIEAIRALIEVDPIPQAYLRLAQLLTDAERPEEAVTALREMPAGGRDGATAIYNAAVEMWNDGKLEATITALDVAIEMDPELPDLYRLKGRTLISLGQDQAGVEVLRQYLTMVPEDDPAAEADRQLVNALGGG